MAALLLRRLKTLDKGCALRLTGEGLSPRELFGILKIGLPAGMQALFMSISSLLIQTCIDGFGPDAMAGITLYAKLEGCLYLPSFAYGIALTGFVGQNYGAGRFDRIDEAVRRSLRLCWAVIFPLSLLITAAIKGFGKTLRPMLCTLLCYAVFRVLWCTLLIPVFPTMRVVYLSYDVSFFLMTLLLLPFYRRLIAQGV